MVFLFFFQADVGFFFQAEDGIRDFCLSRGLGDVYKRQLLYRGAVNLSALFTHPLCSCGPFPRRRRNALGYNPAGAVSFDGMRRETSPPAGRRNPPIHIRE